MGAVASRGIEAIVLDCRRAAPLARFWAEALGWAVRPYDADEVARLASQGLTPEIDPTVAVDAPDGTLTLFCVEVPEGKFRESRTAWLGWVAVPIQPGVPPSWCRCW